MNKLLAWLACLFLVSCSQADIPDPVSWGSQEVCEMDIQDYTDPGVKILNHREINYLMRGDIIDAPISLANKADGSKVWFIATALQQNSEIYLSHTVVIGDLDDVTNAEIIQVDEEDIFRPSDALEDQFLGRHWITNIVQVPEGLIALIHSEYTEENDYFGMDCIAIGKSELCAPGYSQISLAWLDNEKFENNDFSFEFLGNVAGAYTKIPHFNVNGTPWYYTQDETNQKYLNLLFADGSFIKKSGVWRESNGGKRAARLRIKMDDLMTAISNGEIGQWEKQTEQGWGDPKLGVAKSVVPNLPELKQVDHRLAEGKVILHSDAIRHSPTQAYFLSTYLLKKKTRDSSLVFYKSCDGESWDFVGRYHPRSDGEKGWSYLTLVDSDDTDGGVSDGDFDLISGWEYGAADRQILRMNVRVSDGCSCVR